MLRKFPALLFLVLSFLPGHSQNTEFDWLFSSNGAPSQERCEAVANDHLGNLYVTGIFEGSFDLDPDTSVTQVTAVGERDIFLMKLDSNGNFIWGFSIGGPGFDFGTAVTLGPNDELYFAGTFSDSIDLDPDTSVQMAVSEGAYDAFVMKLTTDGEMLWAKHWGGIGYEQASDLAVNADGILHICGAFRDTIDIDPGPGTFVVNGSGTNILSGYVLKLDSAGDFVSVFTYTGSSNCVTRGIEIDGEGNVFVGGLMTDSIYFQNGDPNSLRISAAASLDGYVAKHGPNDSLIWAHTWGSTSLDVVNSISLDEQDNVIAIGEFRLDVDFDPGVGEYILSGGTYQDGYTLKLDNDGNFVWANAFPGPGYTYSRAVFTDTNSAIYNLGYFTSWVDFNTDTVDSFLLTSVAWNDIYIVKLDSNGALSWVKQFKGDGSDQGTGIIVDPLGGVVTVGSQSLTTDFDPGPDSVTNQAGGYYDLFVHRLRPCSGYNYDTTYITVCDSFITPNGDVLTSAGLYTLDTAANYLYCDTIHMLDLTVNYSVTSVDSQVACDSFTWIDSVTYTVSGDTATALLSTVNGCDSLVTLHLTVLESTEFTDVQVACDSFTWIDGNTYHEDNDTATTLLVNAAGCDSLVTLDLTIHYAQSETDEVTACGSYTWVDGNTYFTDNDSATFLYSTIHGCDSLVTLNLTFDTIDTGVMVNSPTITAKQENATYQWISCTPDTQLIEGATDSSFTPIFNGVYAVVIDYLECVDTSRCVEITGLGVDDLSENSLELYPNPSDGWVYIDNPNGLVIQEIRVYDALGRLVSETSFNEEGIQLPAVSGIYHVVMITEETVVSRTLLRR